MSKGFYNIASWNIYQEEIDYITALQNRAVQFAEDLSNPDRDIDYQNIHGMERRLNLLKASQARLTNPAFKHNLILN